MATCKFDLFSLKRRNTIYYRRNQHFLSRDFFVNFWKLLESKTNLETPITGWYLALFVHVEIVLRLKNGGLGVLRVDHHFWVAERFFEHFKAICHYWTTITFENKKCSRTAISASQCTFGHSFFEQNFGSFWANHFCRLFWRAWSTIFQSKNDFRCSNLGSSKNNIFETCDLKVSRNRTWTKHYFIL